MAGQKLRHSFVVAAREDLHTLFLEQVGTIGNAQTIFALFAEYLGDDLLLGVVALNDSGRDLTTQEIHLGLHVPLIGEHGGDCQAEL